MKQSRSTVRDLPDVEAEAGPYMDETMAMVYVGDVYSLVAQAGTAGAPKAKPAPNQSQKRDEPQDESDVLLPFIR